MFYYMQLDENNICIGVSQLSGEVNSQSMILIERYDVSLMGKRYNNGVWEEIARPEPEPTETEQIMQAMTDAELRDLVTRQNQELLAQQMTDIEMALLGGER